jgi:hypothetical protein
MGAAMKQTPLTDRAREYDGRRDRDIDAFWAEARPTSEPTRRRWYIPALLILIALSVPWYREAGTMGELIFGMPGWVWVSLLCTAGVSVLTALAALRFWRDED